MSKSKIAALVALTAAAALPSCATTNSVRWAYDMPSYCPPPDPEAEHIGIRAIAGAPVILGSLAFDAVTWPIQLIFGVWPWWGDASTQMKPPAPPTEVAPCEPCEPAPPPRERPL
jgi:hypothetical protein